MPAFGRNLLVLWSPRTIPSRGCASPCAEDLLEQELGEASIGGRRDRGRGGVVVAEDIVCAERRGRSRLRRFLPALGATSSRIRLTNSSFLLMLPHSVSRAQLSSRNTKLKESKSADGDGAPIGLRAEEASRDGRRTLQEADGALFAAAPRASVSAVDEAPRGRASRSSAAIGREASSEKEKAGACRGREVSCGPARAKSWSSESAGFAVVHSQCGTPSTRRGWSCRV